MIGDLARHEVNDSELLGPLCSYLLYFALKVQGLQIAHHWQDPFYNGGGGSSKLEAIFFLDAILITIR